MSNKISIMWYYLCLYLIVVLLRFVKSNLSKKNKDNLNVDNSSIVSFDIVCASAGFFLVLMEKHINYNLNIAMIYLLLLIGSLAIVASNRKNNKIILILNILVVSIVFSGTIIASDLFLSESSLRMQDKTIDSVYATEKNIDIEKMYFVSIPYIDYSLKRKVGGCNLRNRMFVYHKYMTSKNITSVINKTLSEFDNNMVENLIMYPYKLKNLRPLIKIDTENIQVTEIIK